MQRQKNEVKYDNELNELSFRGFTDYDLSFFMCICSKMQELGEEVQHITYRQIMDSINWDRSKSVDIFHRDLRRMSQKLLQVNAVVDISEDRFVAFNLFSDFDADKKKQELIVSINPKFKRILNGITKNFTQFELSEYIKLDGKYAKLMYQHLKQYRKTGWWDVSLDDFRRMLAIPDSMPRYNITSKVIEPSIKVIKMCKGFEDLAYTVKRSDKRGRAVIGYRFTWTADKQIPGQLSIFDLQAQDKKKPGRKKQVDFEQSGTDYESLDLYEK